MTNIEILEELIENYKFAYPEEESWCAIYPLQMKAIENLIKEYKELKEKVKGLEFEIEIKKYCKVDEVINDLTYYKNLAKEYQGNCISKSKVKEKIEELEKDVNDFEEYWSKDPRKFKKQKCVDYYKLEALKELLEEGE